MPEACHAPNSLIESNRARASGDFADEAQFQAQLSSAVNEVVGRQKQAGIDLPGDGEFGKSMGHRINYGAWWSYSFQRLGGLELSGPGLYATPAQRSRPGHIVLTGFGDRRDRTRFATAYNDPDSGITTGPRAPNFPVCVGPLSYTGHAAIRADIENFKAALAAHGIEEGFMTSVAPGSASRIGNNYYKSDDEFLFACADAMREEYQAIIGAGLILQLDDPSIAENWDMINPEPTVEDYRRILDAPGGRTEPRHQGAARGPHPLPSVLGKLARPAHHRHPDARHCRRDAGDQLPSLFV